MSNKDPQPKSFWSLFTQQPRGEAEGNSLWKIFGTGSSPEQETVCALRFNPEQVFWAMRNLPVEEATKHFLICGTTGSGKTKTIQLFLQSIADRFLGSIGDPENPEHLILFDAKCDAIPLLASMGLHAGFDQFHILNPYDKRASVWSLGEAADDPAMARAVAALLVPEEPNSTARFFSDAARELVNAAILGLKQVAGTAWTLRDLLCAVDSKEHVAAISSWDPRAKRTVEGILNDERHTLGVMSTLTTKMAPFEQVAALWHSSPSGRTFSIPQFLKHPGVLVLGNDPVLRDTLWPINAILLKALTNEILRGQEVRIPRHWFVLDEFRAMERVDCIHSLLNLGRSKGASVLIGLQSVEGLQSLYGDEVANDILSQCAYKIFLRAGGPKTAQWAEEFFGKVRRTETVFSETRGDSDTKTTQYALQERSMFLASYFLNLSFPGSGKPFEAVCDVPCLRNTVIVRRPFDQILQMCLDSTSSDCPSLVPREEAKTLRLLPWDDTEEARFCGPHLRKKTKTNPATKKKKPKLPLRHEL